VDCWDEKWEEKAHMMSFWGKREQYGIAHQIVFFFLWAFAIGLILVRPTDVPPLWFDEGWSLSVARNLVDSGIYAQLSLGQPVPATFLSTGLPGIAPIALSFKLFGVGIWQARLPGQLFTAAALLLLYVLARNIFSAKVASASLFVALLMTGAHIHLHPIVLGRQAIGEIPGLFFLLAGYLCMLAGWRNKPWLVAPAAIFWSLSLSIKPQTLPFFVVSLVFPLVVDIIARERRRAGLTTVALVGSLLAYIMWERMPTILFPRKRSPKRV
jgi:4-amino-4-deoxy-L-arabinose transferase-like glycosyltransferase